MNFFYGSTGLQGIQVCKKCGMLVLENVLHKFHDMDPSNTVRLRKTETVQRVRVALAAVVVLGVVVLGVVVPVSAAVGLRPAAAQDWPAFGGQHSPLTEIMSQNIQNLKPAWVYDTASGIVFIDASTDGQFRAFDTKTGQELWRYHLPAPGVAVSMSYRANEHQFIAIAADSYLFDPAPGNDVIIAFSLASDAGQDGKTAK